MSESHTKLIGTWKLLVSDIEYQESGAREPYFGVGTPSGYLILTPEGRMMVLLASGERHPGQTDEAQAALFRSMIAYTGRYHVEGDEFIPTVDISWNGVWTGTEQRRFYTRDGERLDILTVWTPHPIHPERRMIRGILSWERDQ